MKSSRRSRRHRNPKNEEQKQPFFSQGKAEKQPFFQTNNNSAVQKKGLTVGAPDSKEEKEADTVAKQAINRQEEGGEEKLEKKSEVNRTKLATPKEYEKFGTKDEAMKHDRDIQEKPIQKQDDKEEPVQKMGDKEEAVQKQDDKEEPVQKMGDKEEAVQKQDDKEEPVQKMGDKEEAVQKQDDKEEPVQKMGDKEEAVQKQDDKEEPVQKMGDKEEAVQKQDDKEEPVQKMGDKEEAVQKQDDKEEPVQKMGDKEEAVQKQEEDDAVSTKLQRAGEDKKAPPSFEELLQSTKGQGSPLPAELKAEMESKFGADFSGVRIHTGEKAIALAKSIRAQAFTHGCDIYFNEGKFQPASTAGKELLAHELTHVVQQKGAK